VPGPHRLHNLFGSGSGRAASVPTLRPLLEPDSERRRGCGDQIGRTVRGRPCGNKGRRAGWGKLAVSDPVPAAELAGLAERIRLARAALEDAHEAVLSLLGDARLLQYQDLRELIRRTDQQIGELQGLLLSLLDVLVTLAVGTDPEPSDPAAET
jgi:hypothetical protein